MPDRPNLLLITTHDTGRHFGCYGVPTVQTPAIDRLADDGVRLSNYFSTAPICSASRVSMLTGLYPQTHGQYDLPTWGYEFHDHVQHLSHRMRDAGYQTGLIGLQHETKQPERLAFDHTDLALNPSGRRANATGVAQATRRHLEQLDRSRPFYLQVGFFETHSPFDFSDIEADHTRGVYVPPYIKPTGPAYELMAKLQGAIRETDRAVGLIDDALRDLGLADNTLLVFTSDHGLELPRAKWHLFDPGLEIGLAARWPRGGIAGGRVCDALASNLDFTPTVLELLGLPGADGLQGRGMADLWRGTSDQPIHEHIFGYYSKTGSRSIRTRTHKLMIQAVLSHNPQPPVDLADPSRNRVMPGIGLYDLSRDPLETSNLAADPDHAPQRDELLGRLWQWMEELDDELLRQPPESPNYDKALSPYAAWKASCGPATP